MITVKKKSKEVTRERTLEFLELLEGKHLQNQILNQCSHKDRGKLRIEPYSEGLRQRIWWGAGSQQTAIWAAQHGMNLQSSTLVNYESHEPFHIQQANQLRAYKEAWEASKS